MRQVPIRTLRNELRTQLEDLPVEITKNGQVIAILCTQEDYYVVNEPKPQKSSVCNDEQKTTSHTGGRPDNIIRHGKLSESYFNPQPKGKA